MSRVRDGRKAALGALVASALAAGSFTATPAANATCVSAFGLNNGNGCTSNLTTLAIAIGDGAVANAGNALFGGAIAIGDGANVVTNLAAFIFGGAFGDHATVATLGSTFGINLQFGPGTASALGGAFNFLLGAADANSTGSTTSAIGLGNIVVQLGAGAAAAIGGLNFVAGLLAGSGPQTSGASGLGNLVLQIGPGTAQSVGGLNAAVNISPHNGGQPQTVAGIIGTVALNFFGGAGSTVVQSYFSTALNILGANNNVLIQGLLSAAGSILSTGNNINLTGGPLAPLSLALSVFGADNVLTALNGPLSFMAAVNQEAQTLFLNGPGININNFRLPTFSLPAATSQRSSAKATRSSTDGVGGSGGRAPALRTTETTTAAAGDSSPTTTSGDATITDAEASNNQIATFRSARHAAPGGSTITRPDSGTTTGIATSGRHRKPEASSGSGDSGMKSTSMGASSTGGGKHRKQ